jgi:hypothetical protein
VIAGLAGLAVDTAHAFRERTMMQAAADAAAAAAAMELPDGVEAKAEALAYLEANLPAARHGRTAEKDDVHLGRWDAAPMDAVAVRIERTEDNGNPLPTFLLRLLGFETWDVGVQAVARAPIACQSLRAMGTVEIRKEAVFGPGVCVYGREGVLLERWSLAKSGSRIGMLDLATFEPGVDSVISPGVLFQADMTPQRALRLPDIIDAWEAGRRVPPDWTVEVVSDLPDLPETKTLYIVTGDLRLEKEFDLAEGAVVVRGELQIKKDARIRSATGCATGRPVGVYATGDVLLDKGAAIEGADVVAGGRIYADKDVTAIDAIFEAGTDIILKKEPSFGACRAWRGLFGLETTQLVQ